MTLFSVVRWYMLDLPGLRLGESPPRMAIGTALSLVLL
ncbi:hypothetical protein RCH22_003522 [Cryobacterium psychrotolerans]|nr:hypothetical protein [Cryobacterium psychrotolerans]